MRVIWQEEAPAFLYKPKPYRDRVCVWMAEHGLDPDVTQSVEVVADGDGQIIAHQFTRDGSGRPQLRPGRRGEILKEAVAVPLHRLPPGLS